MHTCEHASSCAGTVCMKTIHSHRERGPHLFVVGHLLSGVPIGIMVLGLAVFPLVATTRYNIGSGSLATSTCSAHFNTPCAIRTTHEVVYDVVAALRSNSSEVLANVSSGVHNVAFNFWPSIFDENGTYVACGRPEGTKAGELLPSGSTLVGRLLEVVATEESGQSQAGLWARIVAAADADGYFDHTSADLFPGHARDFHAAAKDVVSRVGFVRRVEAGSLGTLLVVSSFTDAPFADPAARQRCDWRFDAPCSISYSRRVLGRVATSLLRAADPAALQRVLFDVNSRVFNEQLREGVDAGFYPFVYGSADAICMAHGANPGFVGQTLPAIISGAAALTDLVNGSELNAWFVAAAEDGGGWVGYHWRNSLGETPYLKTAFIVGLRRFGVSYYVGVGYNHQQAPLARGPHCSPCKQDYNYPCAWANAEALIGHAQSLLFMTNRQMDVADAFALLTTDAGYGGGGAAGRAGTASADWLYAFAYDFNGTSVAHGAASRFIGRTLWDIIGGSATLSALVDGRELHERFVAAARNGGGWVAYSWKNNAAEPMYQKIAYVVKVALGASSFYLGVGLGDHNWDNPSSSSWAVGGGGTSRWAWRCSVHRQHPCAEDWAVAVAGRTMAAMLTAPSHETLLARLDEGDADGQFGFMPHVHNSTHVLYDGHDARFRGMSRADWLRAVGLSDTELEGALPSGSWLGPFHIQLTKDGPRAPRYVLAVGVPVDDQIANGAVDGTGDVLTIIVAVSAAAPMLTPAVPAAWLHPNASQSLNGSHALSDGGLECLQRPSAWRSGATFNLFDRVKCVTKWDEIGSSPSRCSDVTLQGICPTSENTWSNGSFDLDLSCVQFYTGSASEVVTGGATGNATSFCSCAPGFDVRFAKPRVLGDLRASSTTAIDAAALPPDAQCAAPEHACATGDVACANHLQLQMTYEQYCSVSGAPSEAFPWVTVTATVSTLSSLLAAIFIAYAVKRLMKARSAWQYREQLRLQAIIEALESTSQLRHPFVFVPASTFVERGALVPFEDLRDEGALRFFDSLGSLQRSPNKVIFFSHQWKGIAHPDPGGDDFRTMVGALNHVAEVNGWSFSEILIWVDFSSIPQQHTGLQAVAVQSIGLYAACTSAFIAVAPTCLHADNKVECNLSTYRRRMWCRAEILCHGLRNGSHEMWVATSPNDCTHIRDLDSSSHVTGLEDMHTADHVAKSSDKSEAFRHLWLAESMHVFQGDATRELDKKMLVPPILGLYAEIYASSRHQPPSPAPSNRRSSRNPSFNDLGSCREPADPRSRRRPSTSSAVGSAMIPQSPRRPSMNELQGWMGIVHQSSQSHPRHPIIWSIIQSDKDKIFPPTMTISAYEATKGIRSNTLASQATSSAATRASIYLAGGESSQHPKGEGSGMVEATLTRSMHRLLRSSSSCASVDSSDSFSSPSPARISRVRVVKEKLLRSKSAESRMVTVELFGSMVARLEKIIDADDELRHELSKQSYGPGQGGVLTPSTRAKRSSRWPKADPVLSSSDDVQRQPPGTALSTSMNTSSEAMGTEAVERPSQSAGRPVVRTVSFSSAALIAHALATTPDPKGQGSTQDPSDAEELPSFLTGRLEDLRM